MMTYDFGAINLKPRSHCMIIIFFYHRDILWDLIVTTILYKASMDALLI